MIVIVNLELQSAYWVEFDINKTERTNSGWSIIIPKQNLFNSSSKDKIQQLTDEVIDYMPQIEYQWELNEQIKNSSLVVLNVSKKEVLTQDVTGFTNLLERLLINDDMIKKAQGKISFFIDGYNNDKREVYEIPEIRGWVKSVIPRFKYWGYFLNMDTEMQKRAGLRVLHLCSVDVKVTASNESLKENEVEFDQKQTIELMTHLFVWLNEFTEKYKISLEINKRQSYLIANTLFGYKQE